MKKINVGVIFLIIIIICYISFFVLKGIEQEKDKENIQKFLKEYYGVYNKYSVLPEEDRVLDKEIDKEKYNEYLAQMRRDLDKFLIPENKEELYKIYEERLNKQVNGEYMFYVYNKEIYNIFQYDFSVNCVRVNCMVKVTVDRDKKISPIFDEDTGKYIGTIKKQKGIDYQPEGFILKKVNGEYKIVEPMIADTDSYSFEEDKQVSPNMYNNVTT